LTKEYEQVVGILAGLPLDIIVATSLADYQKEIFNCLGKTDHLRIEHATMME